MTKLIDASKYSEEVLKMSESVTGESRKPKLAILHANSDNASRTYIKNKINTGEKLGVKVDYYFFGNNSDIQFNLWKKIHLLNMDDSVDGIIVQLPLYDGIDSDVILSAVSEEKDVDGLSLDNISTLKLGGTPTFVPCTPQGVLELLRLEGIDQEFLTGKDVIVVGRGKTSGDPMADLFRKHNCTVTVCHSKTPTESLEGHIRMADIVVSCVGKRHLIKSDWFKDDAVVVGVGFQYDENGKQHLDFEVDEVLSLGKAKLVTSRYNCTGKATVLSLIKNTILSYERRMENEQL